jgi:hypothetical protein
MMMMIKYTMFWVSVVEFLLVTCNRGVIVAEFAVFFRIFPGAGFMLFDGSS